MLKNVAGFIEARRRFSSPEIVFYPERKEESQQETFWQEIVKFKDAEFNKWLFSLKLHPARRSPSVRVCLKKKKSWVQSFTFTFFSVLLLFFFVGLFGRCRTRHHVRWALCPVLYVLLQWDRIWSQFNEEKRSESIAWIKKANEWSVKNGHFLWASVWFVHHDEYKDRITSR